MYRLVNVLVNPAGTCGARETEPTPSGVDPCVEDASEAAAGAAVAVRVAPPRPSASAPAPAARTTPRRDIPALTTSPKNSLADPSGMRNPFSQNLRRFRAERSGP